MGQGLCTLVFRASPTFAYKETGERAREKKKKVLKEETKERREETEIEIRIGGERRGGTERDTCEERETDM